MAERKVKTRVQSKHDVEKNWNNASFPPLPGEIIVYDKDAGVDGGTHTKPRIKIGDGSTSVNDLPFVVDREATDAAIAEINTTLADVETVLANESNPVVTISDVCEPDDTNQYTINDISDKPHSIRLDIHATSAYDTNMLWKISRSDATSITWNTANKTKINNLFGTTKPSYIGLGGLTCYGDDEVGENYSTYSLTKAYIPLLEEHTNLNFNIMGYFYSASENRIYKVLLGNPYGTLGGDDHISFYFNNSNGTLYVEYWNSYAVSTHNKSMYKNLPSDLILFTLGASIYVTGSFDLYRAGLRPSGIIIDVNNSTSITPATLLETSGVYFISYPGKLSNTSCKIVIDSSVAATYTLSYLKESGHAEVFNHMRECNSQFFAEEFEKAFGQGAVEALKTLLAES